MAKVRASAQFCGCCTLLFGVEFIAGLHLLLAVLTISFVSSMEPIEIVGITVSPIVQVAQGAWCLLGIPIIIGAGVGGLYRIESHLRVYFYYLCGCFIIDLVYAVGFVVTGSVCAALIAPEVQKMGAAFVCGLTDTFFFFWMLIVFVILGYFIFTIWSAAEEVARSNFPELLHHKDALSAVPMADPLHHHAPAGAGQYGAA
mmetsp:Transcript_14137/g.34362  ORF Transcript_14137/g.34362 Transcript_14137/m.34362 type:complete len:201 (+) Transcript_14137:69-671(+)